MNQIPEPMVIILMYIIEGVIKMFGAMDGDYQNRKRTKQTLGIGAPMHILGLKQLLSGDGDPFIKIAEESYMPTSVNLSNGKVINENFDRMQVWGYSQGKVLSNKFYIVVSADHLAPSGVSAKLMSFIGNTVDNLNDKRSMVAQGTDNNNVIKYIDGKSELQQTGVSNDHEYLSDFDDGTAEYRSIGYDGLNPDVQGDGIFVGAFAQSFMCPNGTGSSSFMFQKKNTIEYFAIDMMFLTRIMKAISILDFSLLRDNEAVIAKAWFHAMSNVKKLNNIQSDLISQEFDASMPVDYLLQSSLNEYGEETRPVVAMRNFVSYEPRDGDGNIIFSDVLQGAPFGFTDRDEWSLSSSDYQKLAILDLVMTEIGNGCPIFVNDDYGDPSNVANKYFGKRDDGFFTKIMMRG